MVIKLLVLALVVGLLLVYLAGRLERRLMYFPSTERVSPVEVGLDGVQEYVLTTPTGHDVIAWYGPASTGQPTLLYFHGNGGSLVTRAERVRKYMEKGYGVFIMSYRGYSGSTGLPSERANVADAKLAYDTLTGLGVTPTDIILYGESLGSGVAVQVAADRTVAGVILDAPYTSIVDVATLCYPFLPARLMMRDRYETMRFIGAINAPLLVIHGENDQIIPVEMGRRVATAATNGEIKTFAEAGHTDHHLFGSYEAVFNWLKRLRAGDMAVRERPQSEITAPRKAG